MKLRRHQIAALAAAIDAVRALDAPADTLLHRFFRAHPKMGQQDRAFVAEGVFAWLRRRRSLETLAGTAGPTHLAYAIAVRELGLSVRELAPLAPAELVSWLEGFKARSAMPLAPAVAADLPDWLWERLGAAYGEEREPLARALATPAPLDLRINPLAIDREAALAALQGAGWDPKPTPMSPLGVRVLGRPAINRHPLFEKGALEVQDEGSQLIGYLVAPKRNEMVVDFCAGAGGKTLLLGALMRSHGRLYAFDVAEKRLTKLKPRLARSGLSNVQPQLLASERDARVKRLAGKIDRVLVDAPCTGTGTLRRNPDLKWRQDANALTELVTRQRTILDAAATLVKPGGRLVYATCSLLPEENEGVVEPFLAAHSAFSLTPAAPELARAGIALDTGPMMRLLPHVHGCDGFFAAVLTRNA